MKGLGYKVLAKNFTCDLGELDLVMLDGECIVFVEVRSTEGDDAIKTALSVDYSKQKRLTRLAEFFLHTKRLRDRPARFDVLILRWAEGESAPEIHHYRNAFDAVG